MTCIYSTLHLLILTFSCFMTNKKKKTLFTTNICYWKKKIFKMKTISSIFFYLFFNYHGVPVWDLFLKFTNPYFAGNFFFFLLSHPTPIQYPIKLFSGFFFKIVFSTSHEEWHCKSLVASILAVDKKKSVPQQTWGRRSIIINLWMLNCGVIFWKIHLIFRPVIQQ